MLWQDFRFGLRLLRKSPGFAVSAVTALALGIGANAAIFSIVNAVLLRPLPYPHSERLGILWENSPGQGWQRIEPSGPDFVDFKRQNTSLEEMALYQAGTGTINGFGEPIQLPGLRVTTNFLSMLGAKTLVGRDFAPNEGWDVRVAILSYSAWMRFFAGDPHAIGRRILVDHLPYTLVGVTPPNLWLPVAADAFVPWSDADLEKQNRMEHQFGVLARLKPGVSYRQASADLNASMHRIGEKFPRMQGWGASFEPLQEAMVSKARSSLLILLAAVGLVLLIACTNLANLLLARASVRERETAIRTALGAGRWRLVRQFLTETVVIAIIGGGLGLLLSLWGVDLADRLVPHAIKLAQSSTEMMRPPIVMDGRVLAFTVLLTLLTGFVFGGAPALAASKADVNDVLKQAERGSTGGARGRRARGLFVISEVALALVLLICSGLTIKSFWRIQHVDPGFHADHVLAIETELPTDSRYKTDQEQTAFFERVLDRAQALPGVESAAISSSLPLDDRDQAVDFRIEGRPLPPGGQLYAADYRSVSENYFRTMGVPLLRGRFFETRDTRERTKVVLIDQTLADRYWPAGIEGSHDPIGQQIRIGKTLFEIVGIVGAVKSAGLDQDPRPVVYTTYRQYPEAHVSLVVRHPQPLGMIGAVKQAVYAVDREQPVFKARTMDDAVASSESTARFTLILLGVFAAVAILLAAGGIYGLISYAVARRSGEIGIRLALGATTGEVLRLVVKEGMLLAGGGVICGVLGASLLTRWMRSFLFEVSPTDTGTFAAVSALVIAVSFLAAFVPAWRATRIDPLRALRYE
ncbi:MAG TPA: ABC transporter permease [Bryobacteraceae bacterium]